MLLSIGKYLLSHLRRDELQVVSYRKMQWHPSRSSSFTMALGGGPWSLPLGSVFSLHVFRWSSPFLIHQTALFKTASHSPWTDTFLSINCPSTHTARGISFLKEETKKFKRTQDSPLASCWEANSLQCNMSFDPNGVQSKCWHADAEAGWEFASGENASLGKIQPFC